MSAATLSGIRPGFRDVAEAGAGRRQYHKRRGEVAEDVNGKPGVPLERIPMEEFGHPAAPPFPPPPTTTPPPPPLRPPPLPLYIQLAAQQRLQTSSNPHNALFCSFSHCAPAEDSHKRENGEKDAEEGVGNAAGWRERAVPFPQHLKAAFTHDFFIQRSQKVFNKKDKD